MSADSHPPPRPLGPATEALAVALLVCLFYAIHLDLGRIAAGGDYANLFWPMKEFCSAALNGGVVPLWNPHVFLGSPAAATMQHAVFYPVDWLFFRASPLWGAMNLYVLFHLVLAGIGTWWWMRGWDVGGAGAVLAGFAFPCTAWFWGAQEHINQVATVAWMPWMLGVALRAARGRIEGRAFAASYGALGAMQLLVGHPQAAFYTHLAAGALLVAAAVTSRRGARLATGRLATGRRLLVPWIAGGAIAGLIAAVQIIPAMELSAHSYRQFDTADPAYSLSFSMPPDVLKTYVAPNAFGSYAAGYADRRAYGEYGLYVGWATLLLAAVGFAALWRAGRRRAAIGMALLIGCSLLLALGGNVSMSRIARGEFTEFPEPAASLWELSLHEVFVTLLPPARGFRVPARIAVLAALALVTLAGFGAEALLRAIDRNRDRQGAARTNAGQPADERVPPVSNTESARQRRVKIRIGFLRRSTEHQAPGTRHQALTILLLAAVFASLYLPSRVWKLREPDDTAPLRLEWELDRAAYAPGLENGRLFRLTTADTDILLAEFSRERKREMEAALGAPSLQARWQRFFENDNVVLGLGSIQGYEEGLAPTVRTKDFTLEYNRHLRAFRPDGQLLALLGVSRLFSDLPVDTAAFPPLAEEWRGTRRVYSVPSFRGVAFWAEQARGIDFAALEGPWHRGEGLLGRGRDALHDYGAAPQWLDPRWPAIHVLDDNPNEMVLLVDGEVPGDAVLAMGYFPGWETDGGEAVQWLGAVHALVPREAFRDGQAVLRYRPASYRIGLYVSAMGLMVMGLMVGMGRRKQLL